MKITISDKKGYLPFYIAFSLLFCAILILFIVLGERIYCDKEASDVSAKSGKKYPTVIIDAGHGGEDAGAIGVNGVYEKDINLEIALMLDRMLRANGIETVLTRSEDILLYDRNSNYHGQKKIQDLATRRRIAESFDDAVFVSIHMNSFPDGRYSGLQVYYSPNDTTSRILAERIQSITGQELMPENERKIKKAGENIYLLQHLSCPAVLVECGFLSNPDECMRLSDDTYKKQMSLSLCISIINYLVICENDSIGT